jgi:uncharacterized caspase-like protein
MDGDIGKAGSRTWAAIRAFARDEKMSTSNTIDGATFENRFGLEASLLPGKRVALVIGNSEYQHFPPLANPARDAQAIAKKLKEIGFEEVTVTTNQGLDAMRRLLTEFGERAKDADIAVVFYAGHGLNVAGEGRLVPVDANPATMYANPAIETVLEKQMILLKVVQEAAGQARRLNLVIFDACRDNPFAQRLSIGGTRALGLPAPQLVRPVDSLVAYSAKDGSVAQDGPPGKGSPYVTALLEHLDKPGPELNLLFRKVRDTVVTRTNAVQEPWTYGSVSTEDFYLGDPAPFQEAGKTRK